MLATGGWPSPCSASDSQHKGSKVSPLSNTEDESGGCLFPCNCRYKLNSYFVMLSHQYSTTYVNRDPRRMSRNRVAQSHSNQTTGVYQGQQRFNTMDRQLQFICKRREYFKITLFNFNTSPKWSCRSGYRAWLEIMWALPAQVRILPTTIFILHLFIFLLLISVQTHKEFFLLLISVQTNKEPAMHIHNHKCLMKT